jgi:hypothetical protein
VEPRIPLPTDNIYKFYALFGLLAFLFGFWVVIYETKQTNDFMATTYVELRELKGKPQRSVGEQAKIEILERQVEVALSDKKLFQWLATLISGLGVAGMMFGFQKWHSYQQSLDFQGKLLLEKLRLEVRALKRRVGK